jgi:hypothetical protein
VSRLSGETEGGPAAGADGHGMTKDFLSDLPVLNQRTARCAPQKGLPPVLARKQKQQAKADKAEAFRDAVWTRDQHRSRATGKKVQRVHPKQRGAGLLPWNEVGEVDHSYPRSTHPDRIYDVANGILLSKEENRLRKVVCARAPEFKRFDYTGPDDRGEKQTFRWRNDDGTITKERVG